jgi:hypothetical protein
MFEELKSFYKICPCLPVSVNKIMGLILLALHPPQRDVKTEMKYIFQFVIQTSEQMFEILLQILIQKNQPLLSQGQSIQLVELNLKSIFERLDRYKKLKDRKKKKSEAG